MIPLDLLTDETLKALNGRYGWVTGTPDSNGRVLGSRAALFQIPDEKVRVAEARIGLSGKTVVEFGCLEGAETIGLCRMAAGVTAIEGRPENVEKTRVRCALYDVNPVVKQADLETELPPGADVFFHSGVLYHLEDPVGHLLRICPLTRAMLLDTHHAKSPAGRYTCPVDGAEYRCGRYSELEHPKSGLRKTARWLGLGDITSTLGRFFSDVEVVRDEKERYGHRTTIVAKTRR